MFCMSLFVPLSLFYHCITCTFSIYGFWLPLWYLQTFKCRIEKLFKKQHEWNWWNTNRVFVFKFVNRSKYYFLYLFFYKTTTYKTLYFIWFLVGKLKKQTRLNVFFRKKHSTLLLLEPVDKQCQGNQNIMFCMSLFVLLSLFYHCIACTFSIYGFWLPLWYLQTCKCRIEKLFKKQHEWNWWNTNRVYNTKSD
jgi:hypothetical protein